ncbi:MAG: 3'-5' exonuclease [Thermoplasmataceae archaeon]
MNKSENLKGEEEFISVDIEASGPIPFEYSMLSIGACLVEKREVSFYIEISPINDNFVEEAMFVNKLSMNNLKDSGTEPRLAMELFQEWILMHLGQKKPVFVGFNAPFDWQFVNWYFIHYLGSNPFGVNALDIKAYYMGLTGTSWSETSFSRLPKQLRTREIGKHNALADAVYQAEIFYKLISFKNHHRRR